MFNNCEVTILTIAQYQFSISYIKDTLSTGLIKLAIHPNELYVVAQKHERWLCMIISNVEIASVFDQLADLLEIKGEDPFKIRAYRNAARTIENLGTDLRKMVEEGADISQIPTIGEHIALKIAEIIKTGKLSMLEKLKQKPLEMRPLKVRWRCFRRY
jgi:hypothetical protein